MLQRGADNIQIDDEQQSHFLARWVMIGCLHKTSPKRKKKPVGERGGGGMKARRR